MWYLKIFTLTCFCVFREDVGWLRLLSNQTPKVKFFKQCLQLLGYPYYNETRVKPTSLSQIVATGGESWPREFSALDRVRKWWSKFLSSLAPSVSPSASLQAPSQPTINPFSLIRQRECLMAPWGILTTDKWEMRPIISPLKQFANPFHCWSTFRDQKIPTDIWLVKQVFHKYWISNANIETCQLLKV